MNNIIRDLALSFPNSAPYVTKVLQIHKKMNKIDLFGSAPNMCSKLKDVKTEVIEKALSLYQTKAEKDHKAPHPNYFLTICFNLSQEQRPAKGNEDNEPPLITGRII